MQMCIFSAFAAAQFGMNSTSSMLALRFLGSFFQARLFLCPLFVPTPVP
jgi:hypothetical protein